MSGNVKHQADCYRTFDGLRWPNFCDVMEERHKQDIDEARRQGARIRLRKHRDGYHQAFIHPDDVKEVRL